MPVGQKHCDVSRSLSGLYFSPDFDGIDIQVFEKTLLK
jgi:hypothetical protein